MLKPRGQDGAGQRAEGFQSLSRDSVCSNCTNHHRIPALACFNPSVGILCAQTVRYASELCAFPVVSIPQSGFCVLKRMIRWPVMQMPGGFNPSVGILCAQTSWFSRSSPSICSFQSLSRDSVCSNALVAEALGRVMEFQSLSRDSVCSNSSNCFGSGTCAPVSIPQSGFCVLKP